MLFQFTLSGVMTDVVVLHKPLLFVVKLMLRSFFHIIISCGALFVFTPKLSPLIALIFVRLFLDSRKLQRMVCTLSG